MNEAFRHPRVLGGVFVVQNEGDREGPKIGSRDPLGWNRQEKDTWKSGHQLGSQARGPWSKLWSSYIVDQDYTGLWYDVGL